jgi:hypothetical protein
MDRERLAELVRRVRLSTSDVDVIEVCEFAEKCLGSKPKMSELERRERNREYVRRHRARVRAGVGLSSDDEDEGNPFDE